MEIKVSEIQKLQTYLAQVEEQFVQKTEELHALRSQVETLDVQKQVLLSVNAEVTDKKLQLESLNRQIPELQKQSQHLETKAYELQQLQANLLLEERKTQGNLAQLEGRFDQKREEFHALRSQLEILEAQKPVLLSIDAELTDKKVQLESLNRQVSELQKQSQHLETKVFEFHQVQADLILVEKQLIQKQEYFNNLQEKNIFVKQQKEELECRLATIKQQQPNLLNLEQLQAQIQEFKLDKSGLEGQIKALRSQVDLLEAQKRSLSTVEAEFATKKAHVESLNTKVKDLTTKSQELETRAAELEFVRAAYDGLFSQKQSFEDRVNQLRPEINTLEQEKQRILQEIKSVQQQFQEIEQLRQRLSSLNFEIQDQESQKRELNREIQRSTHIKISLEENSERLKLEKAQLKEEIAILKGEIGNLQDSAEVALRSLKEPLWSNLSNTRWNISSNIQSEQQFLEGFIRYIQWHGLAFPQRVIRAFHTSLKVQDISALVILAGISGTGKSELPQRYSNYIGAQLLTLAVQPRWDSPQDLQGFYNYVEKKYKPTDLMRGLYQYNEHLETQDRIVIVLLDEMNLARVEYYFSDFLSKLETRRSRKTYLELDIGSLPLSEKERRLKIPNQFLFVGTMNEDETTQSLSDKVLDRANIITFGKPKTLQLRPENQRQNASARDTGYLTYSDFKRWTTTPNPNSPIVENVKNYLDITNTIMEKMGHPFAHRVYQAIIQYVVNYPGIEDIDSSAFKFALGDQFGQKLLPKLRGLMVDEAHEELDDLGNIIANIGDESLIQAFSKAREGRYGQFQWQGLVYQDEPA